ncbi:MAG: hypothetical protein AAFQ94_02515 [Bacteroidota bacterium]
MLQIIDGALSELLGLNSKSFTQDERIAYFLEKNDQEFSRKDYMDTFKEISSATASRDLKKAIDNGLLIKTGEKNQTKYQKFENEKP